MYFEGKYYKHQKDGNTLCLINGSADDGEFLQIIVRDKVYYFGECPNCEFSDSGIVLDLPSIKGEIRYENLTPLKSDIMGYFRFLPMQCRHFVVSMRHDLSGGVEVDGEYMDFSGGIGYIEGDKGRSFPKKYLWLHCNSFSKNYSVLSNGRSFCDNVDDENSNFSNGNCGDFKERRNGFGEECCNFNRSSDGVNCSIMVSVADIPFLGFHFLGCICAIIHNGREYRLATYHGVKIKDLAVDRLVLVQKKLRLEIDISGRGFVPLKMPIKGKMSAIIHESNSATARFRLFENDKLVFDLKSDSAGYEYNF